MDIKFNCASGSPYAWRIWLALEHKALPYDLNVLSFSAGDLQTPELLSLKPRRKMEVMSDDGFVFYEAQVVVEYLDDAYPNSGKRLFPAGVRDRAWARRLVRWADVYLSQALEIMVEEILFKPAAKWNGETIIQAKTAFADELGYFERRLTEDFLVGDVGAADLTLYPMIALALRLEQTEPDLAIRAGIGPKLNAWMKRMEALPYYSKTYPPRWKTR